MYLRSIRLENIRGFKELELDFTRPDGSFAGWAVLGVLEDHPEIETWLD